MLVVVVNVECPSFVSTASHGGSGLKSSDEPTKARSPVLKAAIPVLKAAIMDLR